VRYACATLVAVLLGVVTPGLAKVSAAQARSPESQASDTAQIAEEAFVYGYPLVMNYGVFYEYFVDEKSPQYKAPFNQLYNTARVYTPEDTAVVTPNSDTPYSFVAMDLRAEPFVFCNPEVEKSRYFSVQLVDLYTFNYGYIGSRTTGNGAACHLITGPGWRGEKPAGIATVFRSETDFSIAIVRTQLFEPSDIENVKKIQAGYRAVPLSRFANRPPPPPAPKIAWPRIDKKLAQVDPFSYLAFVLQFCPPTGPAEVETPLRMRFARIGIQAGKPFLMGNLSPDQKADLASGMRSGLEKIKKQVEALGKLENGWRVMTHGFGDRAALAGNWPLRAAVAMAGIYGNDAEEALYPLLATDSEGNEPDGSQSRYTLTFPAGQLPPANSFWSVTMYDGKTQLLVANMIHRYLVNSPMLPHLVENADGSITLYVQKDPPATEKRANWLPAPDGPIYLVMRLYWPKKEALDGTWRPAPLVRAH